MLQNLWKTSLDSEFLCSFRIAREMSFFRPLSWGALFHRENTVMNPQNTKCHRSSKIFFFRHFWYFSVTKAIHSYVLANFEKIFNFFLFSTPLLDFYRRPLLNTKKQNYPIMKPFEKRLLACRNNQRITSYKGVRKLYTSGKIQILPCKKIIITLIIIIKYQQER